MSPEVDGKKDIETELKRSCEAFITMQTAHLSSVLTPVLTAIDKNAVSGLSVDALMSAVDNFFANLEVVSHTHGVFVFARPPPLT